MTYLKVGDGVYVNGEREIDYSVLPSGYVDVLPLRFAPVRIMKTQPPITVTKLSGPGNVPMRSLQKIMDKVLLGGPDIREYDISKSSINELSVQPVESAADLVNRVAAEQREGKA